MSSFHTQSVMLIRPFDDSVGAIKWSLQGLSDSIVSNECVSSTFQIFLNKILVIGLCSSRSCSELQRCVFKVSCIAQRVWYYGSGMCLKELAWESESSAIDQLCCCALEVVLQCCPYAQHYHCKRLCPFVTVWQCSERSF